MLGRLMKYDLKKIFKYLIWFYAISVGVATIARIIGIWSDIQIVSIIATVFQSLTTSAIVTIFVNTFVYILVGFATSLFKDQSYLTHTLPVKKDTLLQSKYLSALIVILASVVASVVSLFIVFYTKQLFQMLKAWVSVAVVGLNMSGGTFVLLIMLVLFAQICSLISMSFTAIIKGYSYNHKRGVKGFAWFVLYYLASMIATLLLIVIVSAINGTINTLFAQVMSAGAFLTVMVAGIVSYFAVSVVFYFICKKQFNKGVNVD